MLLNRPYRNMAFVRQQQAVRDAELELAKAKQEEPDLESTKESKLELTKLEPPKLEIKGEGV